MKKYGYVIEMKKSSPHYPGYYKGANYAGPLWAATVFNRDTARELRFRDETVRKVELFKNGKPKKVVK